MLIQKFNLEKFQDTLELLTVLEELSKKKELEPYTEETWPMLSDISLLKP
jgi:hypothetical protein